MHYFRTIELPNFNESQIKNDNYFRNLFKNSNKLKYINLLNYEPALKNGKITTFLQFLGGGVKNNLIIRMQSCDTINISNYVKSCCNES